MTAFSEDRLENGIVTLGLQGGPEFSTTVVSVNGGHESRNQNWAQSRGQWQLGNRLVSPIEFQTLMKFFRARRGKFQGFRLKDWADYKSDGAGLMGLAGQAGEPVTGGVSGETVYQLYKAYESGGDTYYRKIAKPVNDGTLKIFVNAVEATLGVGAGHFVPDYTRGTITFGTAPASSAVLTWTGEFDVPVRFDTDKFDSTLDTVIHPDGSITSNSRSYVKIGNIPVIEIRV